MKTTKVNNLEHILKALEPVIKELGLTEKITSDDYVDRLDLSKDKNQVITFTIRNNGNNRANMWCNSQLNHAYSERKPDNRGDIYKNYDKYEYAYHLTDKELNDIGIETPQFNSSYEIFKSIRIEFKADKNPKLIFKDCAELIRTYFKASEIAIRNINKAIAEKDKLLKLQAKLIPFTGYRYNPDNLVKLDFNFNGKQIQVNEGKVTVSETISIDQLGELLNIDLEG